MANMTPRTKRNRRDRVIAAHGRVCYLCGEPIGDEPAGHPRAFTLDHVVAKGAGGGNEESNLRPAHFECNYRRHH